MHIYTVKEMAIGALKQAETFIEGTINPNQIVITIKCPKDSVPEISYNINEPSVCPVTENQRKENK